MYSETHLLPQSTEQKNNLVNGSYPSSEDEYSEDEYFEYARYYNNISQSTSPSSIVYQWDNPIKRYILSLKKDGNFFVGKVLTPLELSDWSILHGFEIIKIVNFGSSFKNSSIGDFEYTEISDLRFTHCLQYEDYVNDDYLYDEC